MKKTFTLFLLLFSLIAVAQKEKKAKPSFSIGVAPDSVFNLMYGTIPAKDDKILYDSVVIVDSSLKKDIIFSRIRQWFAEKFVDANSVLQVNDIDNGLLTGNGTYSYILANGLNLHTGYLRFILNVAVKDGKFRYQIYNFTSEDESSSVLSTTGKSYSNTVNFDELYYMYINGKRPSYTKNYLRQMINLVYYINTTLPAIVYKPNITDF